MELPEGLAGALSGENGRKNVILASGAIGAVALAAILYFVFFSAPSYGDLAVKVVNDSGQPLWRANVALKGLEKEFSGTTDRDGVAVFREIPVGKEITIEASGTGSKTASKKIATTA